MVFKQGKKECPHCKGTRLRDEALAVYIDDKSISDLCSFSIIKLLQFFELFLQIRIK